MLKNKKISNGIKIGIFDPYLDDIGGGERYMMTVASCLSKKNSVDIFWNDAKDLENIKKRFSLDLSKVSLKGNIFAQSFPFLKRFWLSWDYDIIIVLSDGSIPVLLSKKLILHIQQPIVHKLTLKDKLKLRRVNKVICNSLYTKKFIEGSFNVSTQLLYPPISIFGKNTKKENIILHVGRFRIINVKSEDYKKQQIMIDLFKKMIDKGLSGWRFIMAVSLDDVNDKKFINMKSSASGYPIEFLINSSNDKLWKEGSKAKIYWHATGFGEDLEKNPQLAEHFGISTVEAMGAGIVPVVISAGGQLEIVKDRENGFLWSDLLEFEQKTMELINDDKLRRQMSEKSFERAKFFSEENFCKKVQEIIND